MFHVINWIPAASVIGVLIALQVPVPAYGSGFGIFTQGASALGQADAVVAHSNGPSALFFNPALMNQLPGTQIEIGTTLLFPSRDFKSLTSTSSTEDTLYYPSTFYLSHTFNDKISAGLGVFNPFGLGTEWNGTWEGRYLATKSSIETYNINPVVSYKITPDLSFAAGIDVVILNAALENKVKLLAFGLNNVDANQKFKGDGTGVGYNLGVAYKVGHGISLGASYRSEVEIDVKGDVNFALPIPTGSPILDAALAASFPNSGGNTTIKLPRQLLAGIAYQPNDRLTIETGFRWEDWRSYKELKVVLDQAPIGQPPSVSKNWHDTFAVNVGGKYRLNDTFTLLAGYLYGWNPVPDSTFEPAIPDANTHLFCLGTDMAFGNLTLSMSYAYQLQEERNKQNDVVGLSDPGGKTANGRYNSDIHLLGISAGYRF